MKPNHRPPALTPEIRAFLEDLAEMIVEDMLRLSEGERPQANESEERAKSQCRC